MKAKVQYLLLGALLMALTVIAAASYGCSAWWYDQQPKFHGLTVELGTQDIPLDSFYTKYARPEDTQFVTDPAAIDYTLVGEQSIVLRQGKKEETVTLVIQDTVAPTAEFQDLTAYIDYVPTAEEFVVSSFDLSGTEIAFAKPLTAPETYGDTEVEIIVSDPYGNAITGKCVISYVWLHSEFTLELGDTLTKADLLLNPADEDLLEQADIDTINESPVGEYVISSTTAGQTRTCTVTVRDTTGPTIILQSVSVYTNARVSLSDFLVEATDISGEVTTELITELSTKALGTYTVQVRGVDPFGNETIAETTLNVVPDTTPPAIYGLSAMTVEKNSTPDYKTGVSARDDKDGAVSFTYDASGVDTSKAGTYYVIYTAKDAAGNRTSSRRSVTVNHDAADTAALVQRMAAQCSSDPVECKNFVRQNIRYNTNWGGDDPVWYGFTNKVGNCYVHARCLQEILSLKGYSTRLIWTTDQTHYWLIIYVGGRWWHIDATPNGLYNAYGLMDDQLRLATLANRDWNRSAWPACGDVPTVPDEPVEDSPEADG